MGTIMTNLPLPKTFSATLDDAQLRLPMIMSTHFLFHLLFSH